MMTEEEAIKLGKSEFWKDMEYRDIAMFQMVEERLCMPFDVFHEAISKALGRDVYTHEFGLNRQGLIDELRGDAPTPSLADVMNLIPKDKLIVLVAPGAEE